MKPPGHLHFSSFQLPAGEEWRNESDAWVLLQLTQGAAYWLSARQNQLWERGAVLAIPPREPGQVRVSQISEALFRGFGICPGLLSGFFTLEELQFLEPSLVPQNREVLFLPANHPAAARFLGLAAVERPAHAITRRVEVLGIVADVLESELKSTSPAATLSTAVIHRFREVVVQMSGLELIDHSPEELAAQCGCSLRHFHRLFRQQFRVGFRTQQHHLRLLKAQQLLLQTDEPVGQVAQECGYDRSSLFCTLFRRRFGLTPSAWREQAQATGI